MKNTDTTQSCADATNSPSSIWNTIHYSLSVAYQFTADHPTEIAIISANGVLGGVFALYWTSSVLATIGGSVLSTYAAQKYYYEQPFLTHNVMTHPITIAFLTLGVAQGASCVSGDKSLSDIPNQILSSVGTGILLSITYDAYCARDEYKEYIEKIKNFDYTKYVTSFMPGESTNPEDEAQADSQ